MWRSKVLYLFVVFLLMLPLMGPGTGRRYDAAGSNAQSSTRLRASVIGSAGSPVSSPGYRSNGTLGQPSVIGISAGSEKVAHIGFWKGGWQAMVTEAETTPAFRNELYQNYPNPFNPVTTIVYTVAREGHVELKIFDVQGRLVRVLVSEGRLPGRYRAVWDGRNDGGRAVATGMYFYRLQSGSFVSVKKMLVLR